MTGTVEYNLDPEFQCRIKVRVHGMNDQMIDGEYVIPTEMLPWARPGFNGAGGSVSGSGYFSIPKVGSTVIVHGTANNPIWYGNMYISNETVSEINGSGYTNSHILVYDTDFNNSESQMKDCHIKVFFTEDKGFVIDYKSPAGESSVKIETNGKISLTNSNGDSVVMYNGNINIICDNAVTINAPLVNLSDKASESVMKGETFKKIFNEHTHTCNAGETTPPMQKLGPDILNPHVKI